MVFEPFTYCMTFVLLSAYVYTNQIKKLQQRKSADMHLLITPITSLTPQPIQAGKQLFRD